MLDLKFVRSNLGLVRDKLEKRGYDLDLSHFQSLDEKRRAILANLEPVSYTHLTLPTTPYV